MKTIAEEMIDNGEGWALSKKPILTKEDRADLEWAAKRLQLSNFGGTSRRVRAILAKLL